jgi:LmbE family N-acetylglucosaminyl deacetylase
MICNKIGIQQSHIFRLHIPDGCIPDSRHEEYEIAITLLVQILEEVKPDALFVTHSLDFWPYDHVHSSQIAIEAKKRFKNDMQLWFYFVWAWYNVKPLQLFKSEYKKLRTIKVDKLDYKRRLVNLYLQELTPNKKPWSGILPSELIDAVQGPIEVIEKFDRSEPEVMK